MTNPVVSFKNLSIVFGDKPDAALPLIDAGKTRAEIQEETGQLVGVANATFDIQQGELLVLMGLSGSGKSTLLRAINGLNKVCRGEILVADDGEQVNPTTCSAARLRKLRRERVAMVFQQFGLLPWRTVRDNVGFGLELSGIPKSQRLERVEEQLELVGLGGWGDKYVHELSGGMQQRVGLARAFATDAPILLMDEPFSALDPLIRSHLQDELLDLQEKLHRTIVFVSHDLDEAAKIGNRIAIMEGGHVVQIGTPQEIVKNPVDEYVESFVAHMNPLNVLHAEDIMTNLSDASADIIVSVDDMPRCTAKQMIRDVIEMKRKHAGPIAVFRGDRPVGIIREQEIMDCFV
ncbi:glycine betaine/proline transport system ATP-binding protein [Pseudovibrio denitrificans]|uniref:Quaternary amine transport ATP-binding protein n=1 Tax=Pseudovibrio denitrificans TaxID=258256 RepID=A0A1I7AWC5_9HYPH|nr:MULTISPECIES: choline ABC transporter ATP-binding protein [Pseudovibrio]EEA93922.1 choline ABC transporter, ATP-binding protein [Pseudovibrio sp. JE062]SFT79199.1 glycine betaine/proline transport system ATP-binding protein [Pseudovibrio denitrificans]